MPRLSKSRFQTGLQCHKALWLGSHRPDLKDPIGESQQHIFDTGTNVGELARERFADGVLVEEDHLHSAQALETTRRLLEDSPAAIFEAALQFGGVMVRADALVRIGDDGWDLYEVKSTTKLKDVHITDLAIQVWVLERAGLRIRHAYLMHLDNTYVYAGGEYDLERLFIAEDATQSVRDYLPAVPALVAEMTSVLEGLEPQVPIGRRCDSPYTCGFYGYCHAGMPEHPVTALPRISAGTLGALIADGILAIEDVPADYPGLTAPQRTTCELVRSGTREIVGDVASSLEPLSYPIHFLDFESFNSALPLFPGMHPWQQVPFQWSDHILHANGDLEHREFLYDGAGDPRETFARSLVDALGGEGSAVVYSSFESTRLNELARDLPEYGKAIAAILPRLFDLEKVVKAHVRCAECLGATSVKVVLPALVPDLSYDGLEIAHGDLAALRYVGCITGTTIGPEREQVMSDLRAYCGTDTLAMVRLLDAIRTEAAQDSERQAG